MAYKKTEKNKEHAYRIFEKDIKNDQLKNVMLFYGRESYLANWAVNSIVEKYVEPACRDFDFVKFNGSVASYEEIVNCCETLPMFSSRKVVVVDGLKSLESESEDEEKWISYIGRMPDTCYLIFTAGKVDGRKKLFKLLSGKGNVYQFDELDEVFLRKFIEKRLKAAGKTIKPAVAGELIAQSGYFDRNTDYTLYNLENDLKKVAAHAQGDEICREDVVKSISGNIERDVFFMLDAIGQGRKASAFRMLSNLSLYSESEYRILSLICNQYEAALLVKEMKEDGKSLKQISEALGMHEYRARMMMGLSDKYSLQQLKSILKRAYQVDRNIKSGLLDKNLSLELFIASI